MYKQVDRDRDAFTVLNQFSSDREQTSIPTSEDKSKLHIKKFVLWIENRKALGGL